MKETVMYAKYNQEANKTIYGILNGLSNEEREKKRGSYFGSLSDLFRHVVGCTKYFLGMYKTALGGEAQKAAASAESVSFKEEGELSESQWKELEKSMETLDAAYVKMAEALTEADMPRPVKVDWYKGNPETVPLSIMLGQLLVHNTHHRGQISQILDELKIEHNYSGINIFNL